jgi:cell division protein FtsL
MSFHRWALFVLLLVIASGVGVAYSKHVSRNHFVALQTLQQERDELELDWGRLQLEQSTIADTAVIDYAARMRLHMAVPQHPDIVYVRP